MIGVQNGYGSMLLSHTDTRKRGRFFFRGVEKLLKGETNKGCNDEGKNKRLDDVSGLCSSPAVFHSPGFQDDVSAVTGVLLG